MQDALTLTEENGHRTLILFFKEAGINPFAGAHQRPIDPELASLGRFSTTTATIDASGETVLEEEERKKSEPIITAKTGKTIAYKIFLGQNKLYLEFARNLDQFVRYVESQPEGSTANIIVDADFFHLLRINEYAPGVSFASHLKEIGVNILTIEDLLRQNIADETLRAEYREVISQFQRNRNVPLTSIADILKFIALAGPISGTKDDAILVLDADSMQQVDEVKLPQLGSDVLGGTPIKLTPEILLYRDFMVKVFAKISPSLSRDERKFGQELIASMSPYDYVQLLVSSDLFAKLQRQYQPTQGFQDPAFHYIFERAMIAARPGIINLEDSLAKIKANILPKLPTLGDARQRMLFENIMEEPFLKSTIREMAKSSDNAFLAMTPEDCTVIAKVRTTSSWRSGDSQRQSDDKIGHGALMLRMVESEENIINPGLLLRQIIKDGLKQKRAKTLDEHIADVSEYPHPERLTPQKRFFLACKNGDLETAQDLLAKHPIKINAQDREFGFNPLQIATVNNHPDLVEFLVENNAKITSKKFDLPKKVKIIGPDLSPITLSLATNPDEEIALFLTNEAAQKDPKLNFNHIARIAAAYGKNNVFLYGLNKMQANGASQDEVQTCIKKSFKHACLAGHENVVKQIISMVSADDLHNLLNMKIDEIPLLHRVIAAQKDNIATILVANGANPMAKNGNFTPGTLFHDYHENYGMNALDIANKIGKPSLAKKLQLLHQDNLKTLAHEERHQYETSSATRLEPGILSMPFILPALAAKKAYDALPGSESKIVRYCADKMQKLTTILERGFLATGESAQKDREENPLSLARRGNLETGLTFFATIAAITNKRRFDKKRLTVATNLFNEKFAAKCHAMGVTETEILSDGSFDEEGKLGAILRKPLIINYDEEIESKKREEEIAQHLAQVKKYAVNIVLFDLEGIEIDEEEFAEKIDYFIAQIFLEKEMLKDEKVENGYVKTTNFGAVTIDRFLDSRIFRQALNIILDANETDPLFHYQQAFRFLLDNDEIEIEEFIDQAMDYLESDEFYKQENPLEQIIKTMTKMIDRKLTEKESESRTTNKPGTAASDPKLARVDTARDSEFYLTI